MIGVDSGWEIYVGGNGGIKTEAGQFFCKVKTSEVEYSGAFLQLYREGWYLERTVHYIHRVGLDHVKEDPGRPRRAARRCGSGCSSRWTASPIPGSNSTRRRSTRQFEKLNAEGQPA